MTEKAKTLDLSWLQPALSPRSIAIIGASDNSNKIGGRPIRYLREFGFAGTVYPVNPARDLVQDLPSFPTIDMLPEPPDLAVIAVPASEVRHALEGCAARGVKVVVVMSSGFGETTEGRDKQSDLVSIARCSGMRLIGPNSQGIANFATGAVASFSTMFSEVAAADGPVAIVSQSGAMSVLPYALLRAEGIGVRYSHATGNECDLTIADFTAAVATDPEVRAILLYFEFIADPGMLADAASAARARGVPIIALKAGRSEVGQRAAASHTGALATEDRVIDAFLGHHGIFRARDVRELVNAVPLHLTGRPPRGRRLLAISNSGASCVMMADEAQRLGMPMASLNDETLSRLRDKLPSFASASNPIDLTSNLLTNSRVLTRILPVLSGPDAGDATVLALPLAGEGYDLPVIAADAARFAAAGGRPLAVATPLPRVRAIFRDAGVPTYTLEADAMAALDQVSRHGELMARATRQPALPPPTVVPAGQGPFLSEWASRSLLEGHGIPFTPACLCPTPEEAVAYFKALGGRRVVIKGCSAALPHKTEHGLVVLNVGSADAVREAYNLVCARMARAGVVAEGVIVAAMVDIRHELIIGARWDPAFGTVLMLGDGGREVEATGDYELLLHPSSEVEMRDALGRLRKAPVLRGIRGEPSADLSRVPELLARLGDLVAGAQGHISSIEVNPLAVGTSKEETTALDALVELSFRKQ